MLVTMLLVFCSLGSADIGCELVNPGVEQMSLIECAVLGQEIAATYVADHPAWAKGKHLTNIRCVLHETKPATEA